MNGFLMNLTCSFQQFLHKKAKNLVPTKLNTTNFSKVFFEARASKQQLKLVFFISFKNTVFVHNPHKMSGIIGIFFAKYK